MTAFKISGESVQKEVTPTLIYYVFFHSLLHICWKPKLKSIHNIDTL